MYYRIAIQVDRFHWKWKSTVLSSLDALFQLLRLYCPIPQNHLRVFSSSSREELDELLVRENNGGGSGSATAAQFLEERRIDVRAMPGRAGEPREHKIEEDQLMGSIAVSTQAASNETDLQEPLPDEYNTNVLESRRLELERGAGGDHDCPYCFTLPGSMPQALAWVKLLVRVQNGEWSC
jgi:hypothetical protein